MAKHHCPAEFRRASAIAKHHGLASAEPTMSQMYVKHDAVITQTITIPAMICLLEYLLFPVKPEYTGDQHSFFFNRY